MHSPENLGTTFRCSSREIADQPIVRQQLGAFKPEEASLQFKTSGRSRKTGDLSDFDRRDQAAGPRISQTAAELLGFSTNIATISRAHRGPSPKEKKYPVSGRLGGGK